MGISRSAKERRFALLTKLATDGATFDQIRSLPAYQRADVDEPADSAAQEAAYAAQTRMIERDIESLRASGNTIVVTATGDKEQYRLDTSTNIEIDGSDVDMTVLRQILNSKSVDGPELFAQSGVQKLLSSGDLTGDVSPYTLSVPRGDQAVAIAPAISLRRQISFSYASTRRTGPVQYVTEPWRLEVHFGAFYLRAHQVSVAGVPEPGTRMFKVDRIVGKVKVLDTPAMSDMIDDASSELEPVSATVIVSEPDMPLAQRGTIEDRRGDGVVVQLKNVDRAELFDDLMFHGADARLIGPLALVDEFRSRLQHLARLGGIHG